MLNFEDLYGSYAAEVYRFAFWLAGDRHEAEDLTSETFVRAWASRSAIRTETLKAYLFTITRNAFLERQRKNRRHVALEDVHVDPAPGPDELAESRLRLTAVQKVLSTLPEEDRCAFIMRVQHQLPYAEIARVLELSLSSVKVKVHRIRKRLLADLVNEEVS